MLPAAALDLVGDRPRVILGIAGAPGAGKSRLAADVLDSVATARGPDWVAHVPMDGFHLADVQLDRLGRRDRKGAPDTFDAAGFAAILARVRAGEPDVYVPGFERELEQPLAAALVVPASARLIVTEGNYLLLDDPAWRAVRAHLDAVWFVQVDDQVRRERLVARHITFGKDPAAARAWVNGSDEANARLVGSSAAAADELVHNGDLGWSFGSATSRIAGAAGL